MGGVDLLDSLIALYRTKIKSKKWYHRLVYHFVDMTVVQSLLLYRRDSNEMHVDQKDQQRLLQFKTEIAYSLSKSSNTNRKRGRPSFDVDSLNEEKRRRGGAPVLPPPKCAKIWFISLARTYEGAGTLQDAWMQGSVYSHMYKMH